MSSRTQASAFPRPIVRVAGHVADAEVLEKKKKRLAAEAAYHDDRRVASPRIIAPGISKTLDRREIRPWSTSSFCPVQDTYDLLLRSSIEPQKARVFGVAADMRRVRPCSLIYPIERPVQPGVEHACISMSS